MDKMEIFFIQDNVEFDTTYNKSQFYQAKSMIGKISTTTKMGFILPWSYVKICSTIFGQSRTFYSLPSVESSK